MYSLHQKHTITGDIAEIGAPRQVTDKFSKRVLLLKTPDTNPYNPSGVRWNRVEFGNDRADALNHLSVGQRVTCEVYLDSHPGNQRDKYGDGVVFYSLKGMSAVIVGAPPQPQQPMEQLPTPPQPQQLQPAPVDDDPLPF